MAVGLFVGGHIGPWMVRRSPARFSRVLVALAGVGLGLYLGCPSLLRQATWSKEAFRPEGIPPA